MSSKNIHSRTQYSYWIVGHFHGDIRNDQRLNRAVHDSEDVIELAFPQFILCNIS